ncbi:hypothetical protein [Nocardiopsis sp. NPDC006938]|uniref:hypothetical protein n=1 Tax=Nocardiopsis sp. NPDC006938 TaxID=3364337 RepID=UPI0036C5A349
MSDDQANFDARVGEEVYRRMTNKSPASEGKTHGAWTRDTIKNLGGAGRGGGVRALAEKMGVSTSTVRRWAKSLNRSGKGISEEHKADLKRAQRAARIIPSRVEGLKGNLGPGAAASGGGLSITGMIRKSGDVRQRTIQIGYYIPPTAADDVIRALIDGGMSAATDAVHAMIHMYYCEDMVIESLQDISW